MEKSCDGGHGSDEQSKTVKVVLGALLLGTKHTESRAGTGWHGVGIM